MKVFVLNCGSSSFKYQLLNMDTEELQAIGLVERIGMEDSVISYEIPGKEKVKEVANIADHEVAIKKVLEKLVDPSIGVIKTLEEISAVGHRVVHGADKYTESVKVDQNVLAALEECVPLAPLHNPANITGIKAMMHVLPNVPNVAVFDTAFHQTMPPESFLYAIPYEIYEEHKVRRYGFHGTSHKFVSHRAAEILGIDYDKFNCITCHMGNGSSFTAIKNGKAYDTTMGMTPLEGLVMGTRSGDLDGGIFKFLNSNLNMSIDDIDNMLNKKSGLLGISGISSDMRDIETEAAKGNERAKMAIDSLVHRAVKYIGAFATLLERVDAIIFTAGIGENAIDFRLRIMERLQMLGIKADAAANNVRGKEQLISASDSAIKVMIVPTNEELTIGRDVKSIINGGGCGCCCGG
jgi:acetate kinase